MSRGPGPNIQRASTISIQRWDRDDCDVEVSLEGLDDLTVDLQPTDDGPVLNFGMTEWQALTLADALISAVEDGIDQTAEADAEAATPPDTRQTSEARGGGDE